MTAISVETNDDVVGFLYMVNEMSGACVQLFKVDEDGMYRLIAFDGLRQVIIRFSADAVATVLVDCERPEQQIRSN